MVLTPEEALREVKVVLLADPRGGSGTQLGRGSPARYPRLVMRGPFALVVIWAGTVW